MAFVAIGDHRVGVAGHEGRVRRRFLGGLAVDVADGVVIGQTTGITGFGDLALLLLALLRGDLGADLKATGSGHVPSCLMAYLGQG